MPKRPTKKPNFASKKFDHLDISAGKPKHDLEAPKLRKIGICGTARQGKSTLIKDMIARWPLMTTPEKTYRDVIKEKGLTINKEGNSVNQEIILNALVDQMLLNPGKGKLIFDRCPLDNLVYTMWLNEKYPDRCPDAFVKKSIDIVRESLKFLDVIFFIPLTKHHQVPVTPKEQSEIDPEYIKEIDNIFKALIRTKETPAASVFFPVDDCPPIIEIFGDRETRIKMIELYIDDKAEFIGTDDSVINDIALRTKDPEIQSWLQERAQQKRKSDLIGM